MPIPPIIHQMWLSDDDEWWDCEKGPDGKGDNSRVSIKTNSPNMEYRFWNMRKTIELFEKPYFKPYIDFFHKLKGIQKSDVARIMAMYEYGGFYLDLKFINIRPLDNLLHNDLILFYDTVHNPIRTAIFNGAFASFARNELFIGLLQHMASSYDPTLGTFYTTGPIAWGDYFYKIGLNRQNSPQYFFSMTMLSHLHDWQTIGIPKCQYPYFYSEQSSRSGWMYKEKKEIASQTLKIACLILLQIILSGSIIYLVLKNSNRRLS